MLNFSFESEVRFYVNKIVGKEMFLREIDQERTPDKKKILLSTNGCTFSYDIQGDSLSFYRDSGTIDLPNFRIEINKGYAYPIKCMIKDSGRDDDLFSMETKVFEELSSAYQGIDKELNQKFHDKIVEKQHPQIKKAIDLAFDNRLYAGVNLANSIGSVYELNWAIQTESYTTKTLAESDVERFCTLVTGKINELQRDDAYNEDREGR